MTQVLPELFPDASSPDVAFRQFKSEVNRTRRNTVGGLVVAVAGFTPGAVKPIEDVPGSLITLINGSDLAAVLDGLIRLHGLHRENGTPWDAATGGPSSHRPDPSSSGCTEAATSGEHMGHENGPDVVTLVQEKESNSRSTNL